jgi:tetratricopeptide (TPR) repeat protein
MKMPWWLLLFVCRAGRRRRPNLACVLLFSFWGVSALAAEPSLNEAEAALLQQAEGMAPTAAANLLLEETTAESSAALPFARGVFLLRAEEREAALTAFRDACQRAPDFHRARLNVVKLLMMQGEPALAAQELRVLLAATHGLDTGELWSLLARCELELGHALAAEAASRQALLWWPEDRPCRLMLIQALAEQGRLADAALLARREVLAAPTEAWLWGVIANAELQAGRNREAMAVLDVARRFAVATDNMQEMLFELFLSEKLYRLAAQQLESRAGVDTEVPRGLLLRGAQALLTGGAEGEARRVLALLGDDASLTPEERGAYGRLQSRLAILAGDNAAAGACLRRVLTENPLDGAALIALGRLALDDGQLVEAEDCFERARQLTDFAREARMALARVAMAQEDWAEALQQLQEARKLAPSPELDESIRQLQAWLAKHK